MLFRHFCWLVLYDIPDDEALRRLRIIVRVLAGRNRLMRVNRHQAILCVQSYDAENLRDGLNQAAGMTKIKMVAVALRDSPNYPEQKNE